MLMKPVTQEEPMGCAIACVAYILKVGYKEAKHAFRNPEHAITRGYYCSEICSALKSKGKLYSYAKYNGEWNKLNKIGTVVFVRAKKYPHGHFLVRAKSGWMNPWINFPLMSPAKSGFQKRLPGKAEWVIFSL